MESWNWLKMFPAIQTQPAYTFLKAERAPQSWLGSLASSILWGLAEPPQAVLGGSAEPLSVSEEHLADSHGTQALANTVLDFPEEARVPADTDPGPPEGRRLDSVVLSGRSENTQVNEV